MSLRGRLWGLTVLGYLSIGAALWESVGLFSVSTRTSSLACGSPFLGRYLTQGYDYAATLGYMCYEQAKTRRTLTFVFAVVGLVCLSAAMVLTKRRGDSVRWITNRGHATRGLLMVVDAVGFAAGLAILAIAVWAVLRVSS